MASFAHFKLKPEQQLAVEELQKGKDVLAILPTGFGKSVIFQAFTSIKKEEKNGCVVVLVISPLTSIIEDQLSKLDSLGLTAADLSKLSDEELKECNFNVLFSSAEEVLQQRFLDELKDTRSNLHQWLSLIVVDESHTVETWTGKRSRKKGRKGKKTDAFRSAYGKLSQLRSLCEEDVPLLALTGTADKITQQTISQVLLMSTKTTIFISPNRENLRFSILKTTKREMSQCLNWLVHLIEEHGSDMPKTIIFCNTYQDITVVFSELLYKLGQNAYSPKSSNDKKDLLIGIFHSLSWKQNKDRIFESLREDGKKRVIVASTALSMGVDFPDIRYVMNWGPARTLLDQHQEAGRAGRDGLQSHVVIVYHGQQLSYCDDDVKEFVKSEGCYRVAGYKPFDADITPLTPGHSCCSHCHTSCTCGEEVCKLSLPFESFGKLSQSDHEETDEVLENVCRTVNNEDKKDLRDALQEIKDTMPSGCNVFGATSAHGFTDKLIDSIVNNCHRLFTVNDVMNYLPVFSVQHSLKILEILQEIFNDINLDSMLPLLNSYQYEDDNDCGELLFHSDSTCTSESSDDEELG